MSGRFVFLLLVVFIQLAFVEGHHRCHRRHKCNCEEKQTFSTVESMSPSTISQPSVPPNITSKATQKITSPSTKKTTLSTSKSTVPPTTKSTIPPTTKSTIPPTIKSTIHPTTKSTVPPTTKFTIPPTTKSTIPPTTKSTIPPTTKSTIRPTTKSTIPPTTKSTVPPTTKSTITTFKSTTSTPLKCDTCTSIGGNITCTTVTNQSNKARNIPYHANVIVYPTTIEQIVKIVKGCPGNIRVLGHEHSFNEILNSEDTLISLSKMKQIIRYDTKKPSIHIQAGALYSDIIPDMESKGYALKMTAGLGSITVAGAVATGTHGGGNDNKNLADHVIGWTIVLADGSIQKWNRDDNPDLLPALALNLGCLGVIVEMEIELVPTYKLEKYYYEKLSMANFVQHYHEIYEAGYSIMVKWDCKTPDYFTSVNIISRPGYQGYKDFSGISSYFGAPFLKKGSLKPWYDYTFHYMMKVPENTQIRPGSAHNVPYEAGPAAIQALVPLCTEIDQYSDRFELRTVAPDNIWMSPSNGKLEFAMDIIWNLNFNPLKTIEKIEAALAPFDVTSHWGKFFAMGPAKYKKHFKHWEDFKAAAKRWDPKGKFVNTFAKEKIEL